MQAALPAALLAVWHQQQQQICSRMNFGVDCKFLFLSTLSRALPVLHPVNCRAREVQEAQTADSGCLRGWAWLDESPLLSRALI